jgi:transposase-like protein
VKNIRRATRRQFSTEDKIRVVLEGLRGEDSIAELCRREGIVQNLYYRWSKDFLEAGNGRCAIAAAGLTMRRYEHACTSSPPFAVGLAIDGFTSFWSARA